MAYATIRALMTGLIDYAGLFPPARLGMEPTVENYTRSLMGEEAWILGRLMVPASRLDELSSVGATYMPGRHARSGYAEQEPRGAWPIGVAGDGELGEDLERIGAFNARHAEVDAGLARADAIELKANAPGDVERALRIVPDEVYPIFEVPASDDADPRGIVAALAGTDAGAKIRCGGLTPDAIPSTRAVARFIHACAAADVPFKATAGLHHPFRSERPLTYEPDPPRGVMHGFINVFVGAALARMQGLGVDDLAALLETTDPGAFRIERESITWRPGEGRAWTLSAEEIREARDRFAMNIGSCSFDEPVADLRAMGVL